MGGHGVFIRRDDLVDGLLLRVLFEYIGNLCFTPTNENRILIFFQVSRAGIIRLDHRYRCFGYE